MGGTVPLCHRCRCGLVLCRRQCCRTTRCHDTTYGDEEDTPWLLMALTKRTLRSCSHSSSLVTVIEEGNFLGATRPGEGGTATVCRHRGDLCRAKLSRAKQSQTKADPSC